MILNLVDQLVIDTLKLLQTIKQGLNTMTGDGRVDVNGRTQLVLDTLSFQPGAASLRSALLNRPLVS